MLSDATLRFSNQVTIFHSLTTCQNTGIRGLDLSTNLVPSWDTVAAITVELHDLRSLCLNQNRLTSPVSLRPDTTAFQRLEELQVSSTLITWSELLSLLSYMPALRSVEMGYNRLHTLDSDTMPQHTTFLQDINLDSNELEDFTDINSAMSSVQFTLQRLVLTSNHLAQVLPPLDDTSKHGTAPPSHLRSLKQLALSFNRLAQWRDIDMIQRWCPDLESLTLAGNPLVEDPAHSSHARAFTIAKIPSLKTLDGTAISPRERVDSEFLYLSHIAKQAFPSDAERRAAHPQWQDLCTKHGAPDAQPASQAQNTLSNRLIEIRVHHATAAPPTKFAPGQLESYLERCKSQTSLRVLSTMLVQNLRMKLLKSFKIPKARQSVVRLYMLSDGYMVELDHEHAKRELAYWGIEAGTQCVIADEN